MAQALRILYAAGPGDVIGTYSHWKAGRDDPSQVAVTYSGQFYSLCQELGAKGRVISYCPRRERVRDGAFEIEHRPVRFMKGPSPLYHLGQIWYGLRLTLSTIKFHADVAIVSGGAHWFSLGLLPLFGVKVVPTLHCVLWRKGRKPTGTVASIVRKLNSRFFRKRTAGVLSLSIDITQQLNDLLNGEEKRIVPFLPTYRPQSFEGLTPAKAPPPFRVFFAGRIERNKGVFDLLAIARQFKFDNHDDIQFDLCGDGSALAELRSDIEKAGVGATFRCHGHCDKTKMREMYSAAHVVIAPTTSDFIEGFNKVVAEGVLAGKPVITSSVCPALEYVRDAVMEVPVNDVHGYAEAILRLHQDRALYESKVRGCSDAQNQFYDADRGWGAAVKKMLRLIGACEAESAHEAPSSFTPADSSMEHMTSPWNA